MTDFGRQNSKTDSKNYQSPDVHALHDTWNSTDFTLVIWLHYRQS